MEFRWVAIITLWTVISGPIFAPVAGSRQPARVPAAASANQVPGR
jgi:hypothetical protein